MSFKQKFQIAAMKKTANIVADFMDDYQDVINNVVANLLKNIPVNKEAGEKEPAFLIVEHNEQMFGTIIILNNDNMIVRQENLTIEDKQYKSIKISQLLVDVLRLIPKLKIEQSDLENIKKA